MSDAFVIQRSRPIALALAANLGRIARAGSAEFVGRSTEPGAAVIIGGGPSCGGFDRIPPGALSICVNTSAPKVCAEMAPDALVIREVVPAVRELAELKHAPKCIVLDMQTSPVTVARAHDVAPVLWAIPAQSVIAWLPRLLDVEPVVLRVDLSFDSPRLNASDRAAERSVLAATASPSARSRTCSMRMARRTRRAPRRRPQGSPTRSRRRRR